MTATCIACVGLFLNLNLLGSNLALLDAKHLHGEPDSKTIVLEQIAWAKSQSHTHLSAREWLLQPYH